MPQPTSVVQHGGTGKKKRWFITLLCGFLQTQCAYKEGFLPSAEDLGGTREYGGCCTFSMMDFKSGFWQVKMVPGSQQYTTLTVGNLGFYEFTCMPSGLCSAPTTFQCLMQNTLGKLNLTYCVIYLDDMIVFGHSKEEHLECLCIVFAHFGEFDLKLKPSKCSFFQQDDGCYHPVTFRSHSLILAEKNYHSSKLEFLALKWGMMEHFKEYLYALFVVRMENNPLMYILTSPNLDATGHRLVGVLASFEFALEYQKGVDNGAADALSQVPICHNHETVCSLLEGAVIGDVDWSEVEANEELLCEHVHQEDEGRVQAAKLVPMHAVDWGGRLRRQIWCWPPVGSGLRLTRTPHPRRGMLC